MFDGTDLSLAYSSMYENDHMMQPLSAPAMPSQATQVTQLPPVLDVPKATASHAQPPEVPYTPPAAMYAKQTATPDQSLIVSQEPSFLERLADKKADVLKLVGLSLVVLLAISVDRISSHYLSGYISKSFLTEMQEFLIRLAYPVVVILVLWILKASA